MTKITVEQWRQMIEGREALKEEKRCSICRQPRTGFGNDAWPINMGRCCDGCNFTRVIPALIELRHTEAAERFRK